VVGTFANDWLDEQVEIIVPGHDKGDESGRKAKIIAQEDGDIIVEDWPDQTDAEEAKTKHKCFFVRKTLVHCCSC
jgi:hypothetical protein